MEIGCGQQTIKQTPHSRPSLPACNLTLRRPPPSIPAKAGISSRECGKFREAEVQCRLRRCVADDAAPRDSRFRGNGIGGREWNAFFCKIRYNSGMETLGIVGAAVAIVAVLWRMNDSARRETKADLMQVANTADKKIAANAEAIADLREENTRALAEFRAEVRADIAEIRADLRIIVEKLAEISANQTAK